MEDTGSSGFTEAVTVISSVIWGTTAGSGLLEFVGAGAAASSWPGGTGWLAGALASSALAADCAGDAGAASAATIGEFEATAPANSQVNNNRLRDRYGFMTSSFPSTGGQTVSSLTLSVGRHGIAR
jgi:hypothetical protein